jgi:hypothetical protein
MFCILAQTASRPPRRRALPRVDDSGLLQTEHFVLVPLIPVAPAQQPLLPPLAHLQKELSDAGLSPGCMPPRAGGRMAFDKPPDLNRQAPQHADDRKMPAETPERVRECSIYMIYLMCMWMCASSADYRCPTPIMRPRDDNIPIDIFLYIYSYLCACVDYVQAAEAALFSHFVASVQTMPPSSATHPSVPSNPSGPYPSSSRASNFGKATSKKRGRTSLSNRLPPVNERDMFDGSSFPPDRLSSFEKGMFDGPSPPPQTATAAEDEPPRGKRSRQTNEREEESFKVGMSLCIYIYTYIYIHVCCIYMWCIV